VTKEQLIKYLKQMIGFMNGEVIAESSIDGMCRLHFDDAISVRDGLDRAVEFLEGKE